MISNSYTFGQFFLHSIRLTNLLVEMISCSETVTTPVRLVSSTGHTMSPTLILDKKQNKNTPHLFLSNVLFHFERMRISTRKNSEIQWINGQLSAQKKLVLWGSQEVDHLRASATVVGGDSLTILLPAAKDRAISSAFFGSAATTFIAGLMLCEETDRERERETDRQTEGKPSNHQKCFNSVPMVHWQYNLCIYIDHGGVNLGSHTDTSQHSANTDTPHYHIQIWDLGEWGRG